MIAENIRYNENGRLTFGGYDVNDIAERFGTPLYIYDEAKIIDNCKKYIASMAKYFGVGSYPIYAGKAASFGYMYKILNRLGMSADFVSGGELYVAHHADFPMERGFFHGNSKTDAEIDYALTLGVGFFVVDSPDELSALNEAASRHGVKQKILLRITPGIDPHTYEAVATGKVDSKFGVPIKTGQAKQFVKLALDAENLDLRGYHCHIGSQVFEDDAAVYTDTARVMLDFSRDINEAYSYLPEYFNIGGGFGVRYVDTDPTIDIEKSIARLADFINSHAKEIGIPFPKILMEPGRSIVADAGMTLYTVGTVKHIPGYKSYVAIDGGMTDNPRYALYRSSYTVLSAVKSDDEMVCDLVGKCCESGDIIQPGVTLPKNIKRGDTVAVATTGAYNYSMASNYNRIPRPAVVMLTEDGPVLAVRRETYEDVGHLDVI